MPEGDTMKNDYAEDTVLTDATQKKDGISDKKGQWSHTNGPVGGEVVNLFATSDGDVFAGTHSGIYELTDDKAARKRLLKHHINQVDTDH